ncbi:MAG: hypothetical protein AB7S70_04520 [Hyphomicrobium sp.]|uniref:hypothetical protein n=1 Tax=Hyphomicrobium sp. TaxID=82 RepID=UPI003D12E944
MLKQIGEFDIELEPPDEFCMPAITERHASARRRSRGSPRAIPREVRGCSRETFPDGIFARLPDSVALDHALHADGLVYLAFRLTWADHKGQFRATDALMKQVGMGRERTRKARAAAKACGYLRRYQPHNPARGEKAAVAIERLNLPQVDAEHRYRVVWRSWFDPERRDIISRSNLPAVDRIKALAAILFINAMGRPVFARELAQRFGWSRPTAAAVVVALGHAGVVEKHEQRDVRGRIAGVRYSIVKKLGDGFLGDGNVGDIRRHTLDEASSKHLPHESTFRGEDESTSDRSGDDGLTGAIADLRERDLNGVIALRLWRDRAGFAALVHEFGASAVTEVIKVRLLDALIDGRASGSIRSLEYFRGALLDDSNRREMHRRGERPGDVFGVHRSRARSWSAATCSIETIGGLDGR